MTSITTESISPHEAQLDLLRGELEVQLSAADLCLRLAAIWIETKRDDDLVGAMGAVAERMRAAIAVLKQLQQARADAALAAEAALEFRAQRGGRRA